MARKGVSSAIRLKHAIAGGIVAGGLMVVGAAVVPPDTSSGQGLGGWEPWAPAGTSGTVQNGTSDVFSLVSLLPPDEPGEQVAALVPTVELGVVSTPKIRRSSGGGAKKGSDPSPPTGGGLSINVPPLPPIPSPDPTIPVPRPTPTTPNPSPSPAPTPTTPNPSPSPAPTPTAPNPSPSPTPTISPVPITPPDTQALVYQVVVILDSIVQPLLKQVQFLLWAITNPFDAIQMVIGMLPQPVQDLLVTVRGLLGDAGDLIAPGGPVQDAVGDASTFAGESAAGAAKTAGDNANQVTSTVWSESDEAYDQASEAAAKAGADAGKAIEGAPGTAGGAIDTVTSTAKPATDAAGQTVKQVQEEAQKLPTGGQPTTTIVHTVKVNAADFLGTSFPAAEGHSYSLKVFGTYKWNAVFGVTLGQMNADASCAQPLGQTGYVSDIQGLSNNPYQLDLFVDGSHVDWSPVGATEPADGLCSLSNTYTYDINSGAPLAASRAISFRVNRDNTLENAGVLTVEITDTFPTPEALRSGMTESGPAGWVLTAVLAAGMSLRALRSRIRRQEQNA